MLIGHWTGWGEVVNTRFHALKYGVCVEGERVGTAYIVSDVLALVWNDGERRHVKWVDICDIRSDGRYDFVAVFIRVSREIEEVWPNIEPDSFVFENKRYLYFDALNLNAAKCQALDCICLDCDDIDGEGFDRPVDMVLALADEFSPVESNVARLFGNVCDIVEDLDSDDYITIDSAEDSVWVCQSVYEFFTNI